MLAQRRFASQLLLLASSQLFATEIKEIDQKITTTQQASIEGSRICLCMLCDRLRNSPRST